ncbi:hypothetical protein N7466_006834 [Penicillium verhagenii]|uniref:uncharacterized protein n=1 Tax=Penicillium verhagenii TaxID=1562060 RepID=UPI002545209B|nr:uncharacterized protein N7466_006834 [Penicillium verhagenii]KAJ5927878.1 hypothetical protein N7466_006834 [Penicillium verhagenii]
MSSSFQDGYGSPMGREMEETSVGLPGHEVATMKDVETNLNQLARLTAAIRKAGNRSRLQKADSTFDPNSANIRSLRQHLELLLLAHPDEFGSSNSSAQELDPALLTTIQLRLIDANLRRRNRFLYAQKHAQKLGSNYGDPEKTPSEIPVLDKQINLDAVMTSSPSQNKRFGKNERQTPSKTTATAVDEQIEMLPQRKTRPATTVVKHLMGDILPYTCILEDCPKPEIFHMTREAWLSHMKQEHGATEQWVCLACSQKGTYVSFTESAEFTAHIEQQHGKGIRPQQIPMLLSAWKRNVPLKIPTCPLCCFESEDQSALLDHTAEHIHSFSLKSLPWAPIESPEGEEEEDEEEYGVYFKQHPYFEVDSCQSEHSTSLAGALALVTDLGSIAGSDSRESFDSIHKQQQLTEDILDQVPDELPGPIGTKDWLRMVDSEAEINMGNPPSDEGVDNYVELVRPNGAPSNNWQLKAAQMNGLPPFLCKSVSDIKEDFDNLEWMQRVRLSEALNSKAPTHPYAVESDSKANFRDRYFNVKPYANNRIHLPVPEGKCDYINASLITLKNSVTKGERKYIATQASATLFGYFILGRH